MILQTHAHQVLPKHERMLQQVGEQFKLARLRWKLSAEQIRSEQILVRQHSVEMKRVIPRFSDGKLLPGTCGHGTGQGYHKIGV